MKKEKAEILFIVLAAMFLTGIMYAVLAIHAGRPRINKAEFESTERGLVIDIRKPADIPPGINVWITEVKIAWEDGERSFLATILEPEKIKKGDTVEVQWIKFSDSGGIHWNCFATPIPASIALLEKN